MKLARTIDDALHIAERKRAEYENAQSNAEEALTDWFESHFAELVKRFPRRRFLATSGMGSLSVDVFPGPTPFYSHHPNRPYQWIWNLTGGNDSHWAFLWQEWEDLLDEFAKRSGLEYVNFTRDVDVRGPLYKEGEE